MYTNKIMLRNLLVQKKIRYKEKYEHTQAIEIAVIKGVYKGIGGVKEIPLPKYYDRIVDVVSKIVKVRKSLKGDIISDIRLLERGLKREFYDIAHIDIEIGNAIYVQIQFIGFKLIINSIVDFPISSRDIVGLASILIGGTDMKLNEGELDVFENTLLQYIGGDEHEI